MSRLSGVSAFVLAVGLLAGLWSGARADVLVLVDGQRIEGQVVSQTAEEVELKLPFGSMKVRAREVARIERRPSPEREFDARLAALAPGDANERVALARVAMEKLYCSAFAGELATEAWRIDPANAGALEVLRELDYRFDHGTWMPPSVYYPDHGFARREARWVTVEEAAYADARARTAAARAGVPDAEKRLRAAEQAVEESMQAQADAQMRIAKAEVDLTDATATRIGAEAVLRAREADLQAALSGRLSIPGSYIPGRGADPYALYASGVDAATRARDAALRELEDARADQRRAAASLAEARSRLETAKERERTSRAEVPKRQAESLAAKGQVTQAAEAEIAAKAAVAARKARDGGVRQPWSPPPPTTRREPADPPGARPIPPPAYGKAKAP